MDINQEEEIKEFYINNEDKNWKIVEDYFKKAKSAKDNADKAAKYFGIGLGWIWGINRARGKWGRVFKSLKRGVGPVSKKIEAFIKLPISDKKKPTAYYEMVNKLATSCTKQHSNLRNSGVIEALTTLRDSIRRELDKKDKSRDKRRLKWLDSFTMGQILPGKIGLLPRILSFTKFGEGEKCKIEEQIEEFCKNLNLDVLDKSIKKGMKQCAEQLKGKDKKFDELMKKREKKDNKEGKTSNIKLRRSNTIN